MWSSWLYTGNLLVNDANMWNLLQNYFIDSSMQTLTRVAANTIYLLNVMQESEGRNLGWNKVTLNEGFFSLNFCFPRLTFNVPPCVKPWLWICIDVFDITNFRAGLYYYIIKNVAPKAMGKTICNYILSRATYYGFLVCTIHLITN